MTTQTPPKVDNLAKLTYLNHKWVRLEKFVTGHQIQLWKNECKTLPSRRVVCGGKNNWGEQVLSDQQSLYQFFLEPDLVDTLSALTSRGSDNAVQKKSQVKFKNIQAWTCCYNQGEYINQHKDTIGSIQLLICLEAPTKLEGGGVLHVFSDEEDVSVFMNPGDAVIIKATDVVHYTTPVNTMRRVIAVARYFF